MSTPRKRHRLSKMYVDFVSLVPAGDDPAAQVVISKAAHDDDNDGGTMPEDIISKADLPQDVVDYIEGLETEVDTLTKDSDELAQENESLKKSLAEAEASGTVIKSEDEQFEALLAKVDPATRVLLKKEHDEKVALQKRFEDEREVRLSKEYVSKAAALPMLNEGTEGLGDLLRKIDEHLDPEDAEKVQDLLAAANTQIAKSGLFSEFGRTGGETTVSKSVTAAAEEVRKAHPELTIEQATARAYEENPALLEQAMTEGR